MSLHEQSKGATDEWYTPPHVFMSLDCQFDMDVASPGKHIVPWIPAPRHLTENSLEIEWEGFIWMNPPFGGRNGLIPWLRKFMEHGNGIALVPDRTSAPWFQEYIPQCDYMLCVGPKIKFIDAKGNKGISPAQGTCLLSIGDKGSDAITNAAKNGLGIEFKTINWKG